MIDPLGIAHRHATSEEVNLRNGCAIELGLNLREIFKKRGRGGLCRRPAVVEKRRRLYRAMYAMDMSYCTVGLACGVCHTLVMYACDPVAWSKHKLRCIARIRRLASVGLGRKTVAGAGRAVGTAQTKTSVGMLSAGTGKEAA